MSDDLSKVFQETDEARAKPTSKKSDAPSSNGKLLFGKKLKQSLIERRQYEIELALTEWEANGKNGRKPTNLSPIRTGIVLEEYLRFCLFDTEEYTRLAMYQPDKGTYTQNETIIRRVISWLEPTHNANKASDVIYYLINTVDVQPKTVSRYLIPVKNGVFDLKTKKLQPFTPDLVFTSKIATSYTENASLPTIDGWDVESWLEELACGDVQLVNLLWQVISSSLNGNYTRKKSIWLVGSGSNGKGTFQDLLQNLIGSNNVASLKINQFSERFKLGELLEKVCCIGDDVQAGVYIDDSSDFNSVVTGDPVLIEVKNKMGYKTRLQMTIIQSTNGMPKIRNKTNGTYRRLLIVPFNASFSGNTDNRKIKDDYMQRPDVLNYVLCKAINLDFEEFSQPDISEQLLDEYKQENDPMVDFKTNVFDGFDSKRIPFYIVYSIYKEFCKDNGYTPLSKIKFSKEFNKLIKDKWENVLAKCRSGDLGTLNPADHGSYAELPTVGRPYQQYIRSDLHLVS